jgi:hypothetical protein
MKAGRKRCDVDGKFSYATPNDLARILNRNDQESA